MMIAVKVLGTIEPQEEVAKLEPINERKDKTMSRTMRLKKTETKKITREITLVEGTPVLNVEE